jgi:myo-inositol 2-dehydrogenase / D-chiro-inositol 1-dehydrogenase
MNIGVIGAGLMGTTHIRVLTGAVTGARVVAVSDAFKAAAERAAAENRIANIHADPYELIRDPEVQAVIIASPAPTHEDFTLACLEAGKPVLCEKPLAIDAEASLRVVEAEAALGRRLVHVGFMRRFDPGYTALKARLDAGEVGAALVVHCAHRNPIAPPTFTSESIITDSIIHEIDTIRWLLGEEIARTTVFAPRASGLAPAGLQDPMVVMFETESGRLVDVECFVNAQYGYDIRCEIVGETGALELARGDATPGFQQRFGDAYVHELQSWIAGEPAGASAWDGYAAAAVCEAAVASLHTRRTVDVRLAVEVH